MKARFIKSKKLHPLAVFKHTFSRASSDNETKRKIFRRGTWKLGMKAKSILAIAIIAIMLVSVFGFLPKGNNSTPDTPQSTDVPIASPNGTSQPTSHPTSKPADAFSQITDLFTGMGHSIVEALSPKAPGTIESAQTINSSVWRQVAANAWQYFQPGVGVDPNTALPRSGGSDSPVFTDWDLGVYIQAVMDANATGVIGYDGAWGSSARLEKVVSFLETRELNNANYPYWFYRSVDGKGYHAISDRASSPVDLTDTGRLFVALNNLRVFNSSLAPRVNDIVLHGQDYNRSNYDALVRGIQSDSLSSNNIYAYYVYSGFASFWPNQLSDVPNRVLTNMLSSGNITTNGVTLPISGILGDPLLGSVFDLHNNSPQLTYIMQQVYLAHEAYFNATGVYRAFSEGASLSDHWTYEWVVLPDNRTWVILDETQQPFNISPIIYTKIAMGFLAIYNTTYAYNMVVYLEKILPDPANGYSEGVDESGAQLTGVGSNTNGMILGAANYAIKNNP